MLLEKGDKEVADAVAVATLLHLMEHPSVVVQKNSLIAATNIYCNTFPVKAGVMLP